MKLLLSILLLILGTVLGLTAFAGAVVYGGSFIKFSSTGVWSLFAQAGIYLMLYAGLISAMLGSVIGPVIMMLAFIFKSWFRAIWAAGMSIGFAALWGLFMTVSL